MPIKLKANPTVGSLNKYYLVKDQKDHEELTRLVRNTYGMAFTLNSVHDSDFPVIVGVSGVVFGNGHTYIDHRIFKPDIFQEICKGIIAEAKIAMEEADKAIASLNL